MKTLGAMVSMQPIVGPTAWTGAALAERNDWIHALTSAELTEIESAIDVVAKRGLRLMEVTKADFALPGLANRLARIRTEIIHGRGFALLRGLPIACWDRASTALAYWGIGLHLGNPVSQNLQGHLLGHVKDVGGDFHDLNARAGYRSRARLPFHTDLGADLVGLLCLRPGQSGGASRLVSAHSVYNAMLSLRPDLVETLLRPIHRDRRGELLPGKAPTYAIPVFCFHAGWMTCTFVRRFIDSAPRHLGVPPVSPQLAEALDLLESLAEDPTLRLDMDFRQGDIQLINNLTLLHGRTAYSDPSDDGAAKRHLLRLWLTLEEGWPLPPEYYERFGYFDGTGRPLGMAPADVPLSAPLYAE